MGDMLGTWSASGEFRCGEDKAGTSMLLDSNRRKEMRTTSVGITTTRSPKGDDRASTTQDFATSLIN